MELQKIPVFVEDMEGLCASPLLAELCGKTVLVTGATGLIGQTLVSALLRCRKPAGEAGIIRDPQAEAGEPEASRDTRQLPDDRIRVIACVRDEEKARRMFGGIDAGNLDLLVADITDLPAEKLPQRVDYMIHAASQTSSRAFIDQPVETIFTAVDGTRRALEFARVNKVRAFLYLSTMEVYGTPADDHKIDEKHGTNLDTMQPRSCYPESKRLCEMLCTSWQKEYGVPVRVMRLTQTFGPGVKYDDGRVFAEFARCALEGRDIVLKTAGLTCRNYLYTADAVSAMLTVLLRGEDGEAYNAANEATYCSIRQMAELVASECAGGRIGVRIEAEEDPSSLGYAPTLHMNLDTTKLQALGWQPVCGLAEAYRRMMEAMKMQGPAVP